MIRFTRTRVALLIASLSLAPAIADAATDVPALPNQFAGAAADDPTTALDAEWWAAYGSPELSALLASAERENLDVRAAAARLQAAGARARAAHASTRPTVDAGLGATHYAGHSNAGTAQETDAGALLSASYEIDFWGKHRATIDSAVALEAVSRAERDTVVLATKAALAAGYFNVLSTRERLHLAESDLASTQKILSLIEARHAAHAVSDNELASQRGAVAAASLMVIDLTEQDAVARESLAVLAGRDPSGFLVAATDLSGIRMPSVGPGLPATLLQRRPDIEAAERALAAAHADVAVARAALFPSVTLTAAGGLQNPAVQAAVATLTGTGATLTLGAQLVQSVFDGGRRRAVRAEAEARETELLLNYRSTIRNALVDVETALSVRQALRSAAPAQDDALAQSQRALDVAEARYRAGVGDYLNVLDAERAVTAAQQQMAQYRLARLLNTLSLAKALGGGWHHTDSTPVAELTSGTRP